MKSVACDTGELNSLLKAILKGAYESTHQTMTGVNSVSSKLQLLAEGLNRLAGDPDTVNNLPVNLVNITYLKLKVSGSSLPFDFSLLSKNAFIFPYATLTYITEDYSLWSF